MTRAERGERCLLTLGSRDHEVLVRPWEMARVRRGPLAFQGVSLRPELGEPGRVPAFPAANRLRVLLTVSRPTGIGFNDPRTSTRPALAHPRTRPRDPGAPGLDRPPALPGG